MKFRGYTTGDIIEALNIPKQRLRVWLDNEYIKPSIRKASGAGTTNAFARVDIYLIALFKHLLEVTKIPRADAAIFVDKLRNALALECVQYIGGELHQNIIGALNNFNIVLFKRKEHEIYYPTDNVIVPVTEKEMEEYHDFLSSLLFDMVNANDWESWDDVMIVNFKKIREDVDKKLK